MVVARGCGEGKTGIYCLIGLWFQFCKMKSSRDSLNSYVNIINTTELHT